MRIFLHLLCVFCVSSWYSFNIFLWTCCVCFLHLLRVICVRFVYGPCIIFILSSMRVYELAEGVFCICCGWVFVCFVCVCASLCVFPITFFTNFLYVFYVFYAFGVRGLCVFCVGFVYLSIRLYELAVCCSSCFCWGSLFSGGSLGCLLLHVLAVCCFCMFGACVLCMVCLPFLCLSPLRL